jgi:hypothetical protein
VKNLFDNPEALQKVKNLSTEEGITVYEFSKTLPIALWFCVPYADKKDKSVSGNLVGFDVDSKGKYMIWIWYVNKNNEVFYVNDKAKDLTPYLKKASNIDLKKAYGRVALE